MQATRKDNVADAISSTLASDLTPKLRILASRAGWPSRVVSSIEVRSTDGELYVYYPEEIKEEVENLEYGDINSLPNAVIRPFLNRAGDWSDEYINKDFVEALAYEQLGKVL